MEKLDIKALEVIEKSRGAQLGEVRTWGGKEYIKTPKGWRPKPKGYKEGEKKQEVTEAGNPVGKPESVTPKKVTDQLKVGDRVMYNGKEMILTRISKDGRFQNGIEMKFAKEGETTPTGSKTKVGNMMYATPIDSNARENKFVPLFGGNEGRIIDTKPNGDLIVEYRRKGEKNWTDIVKVGSDDYKNLTDSWGRKDNKHFKFEDKGGGKFELEIPGKGGAQISEGDGKFEVKVWDENYKYITDDSKRHVFDSKSEAEDFARILLDKNSTDSEGGRENKDDEKIKKYEKRISSLENEMLAAVRRKDHAAVNRYSKEIMGLEREYRELLEKKK